MGEARTELGRVVARWRAGPRWRGACDDRQELLDALGGLSAEQVDEVGELVESLRSVASTVPKEMRWQEAVLAKYRTREEVRADGVREVQLVPLPPPSRDDRWALLHEANRRRRRRWWWFR